jgi:hypothetical protein
VRLSGHPRQLCGDDAPCQYTMSVVGYGELPTARGTFVVSTSRADAGPTALCDAGPARRGGGLGSWACWCCCYYLQAVDEELRPLPCSLCAVSSPRNSTRCVGTCGERARLCEVHQLPCSSWSRGLRPQGRDAYPQMRSNPRRPSCCAGQADYSPYSLVRRPAWRSEGSWSIGNVRGLGQWSG